MTGLKISQPLSNELIVGFSQNVPANSPIDPAPSLMSPPAQNALPGAGDDPDPRVLLVAEPR